MAEQPKSGAASGAGWVLLAVATAGVGAVTFAAAASVVAQDHPLRPAGFAVAAAVLAVSVLVPLGIGTNLARALRRRGYAASRGAILATAVALVNLAGVVGIQVLGPAPVRVLWTERGTWVVDAMIGRGPFGPAAVPVIERRLAEVEAADHLQAAIPLWCDEDAAAFAVGLAGGLAQGSPAPLVETLGRVTERHGVTAGAPQYEDIAGRALLSDVADLVGASYPDVALPPQGPIDPTPTQVSRHRIGATTTGWEARYEEGAWRWCPGTVEEARARGEVFARALQEQARRVPTAAGPVAGPWDAEVRTTLQRAAFGRAAWLAGSTAVDATWGEALTRSAALAQAERIRAWCTVSADPARKAALDSVVGRWSVPPVGQALDPSNRTLLETQGRRYLADVLGACSALQGDRQVRDAASGVDAPEAQRRRWAELEARAIASEATLADDGTGGVRVHAEGRDLRAVQEDGSWRIDWRD
ncbi:MAG: hypothetical protein ABMA64_05675 [Myxococcota bacterium]